MHDSIYQPTDLTTAKRREFIDAAKTGRAHLRDSDGTGIVALPARELELLDQLAAWSSELRRLDELLESGAALTVQRLDRLAWLRVFDAEDIRAFADEMQETLIIAMSDRDPDLIKEVERAWRTTASEIEDPLRREALTSGFDVRNFRDAAEVESNES
jgi:hypothetical protein